MLRRLGVTGVRGRERGLILLRPKQVDSVHSAVFFYETSKMSVECGLRCLWASDLDSVAEGLQALLLPEYCTDTSMQ